MDGPTRQEIVADLRSLLGPDRAVGDTVIPPLAFFVTNALAGLGWAAVIGLVAGAVLAVWRWAHRHRLASAVYGFAAVAVSVASALRTDRAAGYVLPTIVMTAGLAVLTAVLVFARRPMARWVSAFVRKWPLSWYWRDDVRPAYARVSWYWFAFYTGRVTAVVRGNRRLHLLGGPTVEQNIAASPPPFGHQRGF